VLCDGGRGDEYLTLKVVLKKHDPELASLVS
jgi:hypothetical protein